MTRTQHPIARGVTFDEIDRTMKMLSLNGRAQKLCDLLEAQAADTRVDVRITSGVSRLIDCGVAAVGGIEAGLALAKICMAGLAEVTIVPGRAEIGIGPAVQVRTDHPLAACMASQYAGWQLAEGKFFAMGSGPMRAAAGKESVFDDIGHREDASHVVGVLETSKLPPDEIFAKVAADCRVSVDHVTLLAARTASMAGSIQVVARSLETALHKLHTLGFDLHRVQHGYGVAPLPPIANNDLTAIGWTNDAVLYGGDVTMWVRGDDERLSEIGARVPSCESGDYGEPFATIFERYNRDFYQIDPLLFSPAQVTFVNLDSGRVHRFGQLNGPLLAKSFALSPTA
jgi:methenyltetrahydromethanopterin cyclohydrolase